MSTHVPSSVPADPSQNANPEAMRKVDHITIYGHSNLLYWWPVWLVCFIAAGLTYTSGSQMAVVPNGTVAAAGRTVEGFDGPRDVLVAPPGTPLPLASRDADAVPVQPSLTVSGSNNLGVVFAATLLLVALVSNVLFRGLVSLIIIILLITAVVTLALFDLWDDIFAFFGGLDIRMNAAGYLFIGIPLFVVWAFVTFVFDHQVYMVFDEGQIRYVLEIGDSAMVASSEGAIAEKKRSDVFRHWLLGFGTGDLLVKLPGGQHIELHNVTNANRKMALINDMLRHKAVVVSSEA
jgi:hypothetical protein